VSHTARVTTTVCALALASFLGGCASNNKQPQVASSGGQAAFAVEYPEQMQGVTTTYTQHRDEAKTMSTQLSTRAADVKAVKGNLALQVVDAADAAGKSESYVEQRREIDHARKFFTEGKSEISQKVAGSVMYAAKGCNGDSIGGAVPGALKDAVDKRAEKQLRQSNEAHLLIERNRPSLGPAAAPLEKLADDVSNTAYVVYIEMPAQREKLRQLVAEADQVKKTADDFLATEGKFQSEPGRTDPEKKGSQSRIEIMNKSKAAIDPAVEQAKAALAKMDQDIQTAQKEYKDALDKLRKDLPQK
jgi:hypothetical protein